MEVFFSNKKKLAILIDPSSISKDNVVQIIKKVALNSVDFIFLGGSLISKNNFEATLLLIKSITQIPVLLFPGNSTQISKHADAILFLSLISGRNPDLLIGTHVISAPLIRSMHIPTISVGYMLIDGGIVSSVQYMSNTMPIPNDKPEIAACTAMAGEMLGLKSIYLEAGSGAKKPVSEAIIKAVKHNTSIPLIVGGGIRNGEQAKKTFLAGADIIVVGNILEKDPDAITSIADIKRNINKLQI